MKIFKNVTCKELIVNEHSQYNRIDCEDIIVKENVIARFYGRIRNSLTIEKGAIVHLHGSLTGELINKGGKLNHYSYLSQAG